jgi:hypothetical protein
MLIRTSVFYVVLYYDMLCDVVSYIAMLFNIILFYFMMYLFNLSFVMYDTITLYYTGAVVRIMLQASMNSEIGDAQKHSLAVGINHIYDSLRSPNGTYCGVVCCAVLTVCIV